MATFKGTHDLVGPTDASVPAEPTREGQRSDYCYLFEGLANADDAGVFKGCNEDTTIARLKEFEESTRPVSLKPAVAMQLPAAYTYFGQFMNHDISAPIGGLLVNVDKVAPVGIIGTADPAGLGKSWRADVATILEHFVNEHSQPLTLASLYGDRPSPCHSSSPCRSPSANMRDPSVAELYEADGKRFRLGSTKPADRQAFIDVKIDPERVVHATGAPDILRRDGLPLIADLRNDGNLILCQLHLAFMLVHNKAVAVLEQRKPPPENCFAAARHLVTLHYQWLILNDFLPSLLSKAVVSRPLSQWVPRETKPNTVPMEFTTAAFRFGHSMVGARYDYNANFGQGSRIGRTSAELAELFDFTSHGTMGDPSGNTLQLPDHWVVDWDRMTSAPGTGLVQHAGAEQIDLAFAVDMLNIAGDASVAEHGSIMFRNLLRGFHRRMPFGQRLAEACNVKRLSPEQVQKAMQSERLPAAGEPDMAAIAKALGFLEQTPAWLYFLCESKVLEDGERVGPTASQIIADTIVGLLRQNPDSVLRHDGGGWHPRDSVLRDKDDREIDTIRAFLLFATEGIAQT